MSAKTGKEIAQEAMEEVPVISCGDYRDVRTGGEDHAFLDVREKEEFEDGHLEGAISVPRGLIEFKIEEVLPDKDKLIVVCCAKGGRAALAGQTLMEMGYTNIKYLKGGYTGYCEEAGKDS